MKLDRDKLIRAREMLGYGIETVAEEAGVSKNSVLRAEHEEDIRPLTSRKIAAALGVRVADLIGESENLKVQPPLPFNGPMATELPGLKAAREQSGIGLNELAARTGLSVPEIKTLEEGGQLPDPIRVGPVADVLGCSMAQLIFPQDQYEQFLAEAEHVTVVEEDLSNLSPETILALRRAHDRAHKLIVDGLRANQEDRDRQQPEAG